MRYNQLLDLQFATKVGLVVIAFCVAVNSFSLMLAKPIKNEQGFEYKIPDHLSLEPLNFEYFKNTLARFEKIYPSEKIEKSDEPKSTALAEDNKQSLVDKTIDKGFLAFGDEYQIALMGVFNEQGELFAAIKVVAFATKIATWHKLQLGSRVHDYVVTDMKELNVTLDNGRNQITLTLFKQK